MAEWLKAPVLKTGDVKASVGSNPTLSARLFISHSTMQKYPSGRRGSPAKGVGGLKTRARVQIPPSAPSKKPPFGVVFLLGMENGRDLKPKRVSSVKKMCRWHIFSCEVCSGYAARTDHARHSRSGIIPPSAPNKDISHPAGVFISFTGANSITSPRHLSLALSRSVCYTGKERGVSR